MCVWNKEVRYFSRGIGRPGFDACWYRNLYPCPPVEDEAAAASFVAYDGSPDYMVLEDAAVATMRAQLGPSVRLVALLRNPSDRFYSAYNMGMNERRRPGARLGYDAFASSLDRMLACAPECPDEQRVVSMFFNYGLYARHLRRYMAHFGREALLVEASEAFYAAPWPTVARVLAFAKLPELPSVKRAAAAQAAPGQQSAPPQPVESEQPPRGEGGGSSSVMSSSVPAGGRGLNSGRVWGGEGYTGRLRPAERAKLAAFYAPHNRELYALLGRDFGWERGGGGGGGNGAEQDASPPAAVPKPELLLRPEL